ncbi:MAG: helix-turn-helix domain-containing protein [archaeon]
MDEIVHYMQKLGLNLYQSRAMVVLLATGEAEAKQICECSGVPYTKIYQILKQLEDKGLIEYKLNSPRTYKPRGRKAVLNKLVRKEARRVTYLENEKERQLQKIGRLKLGATKGIEQVHPVFNSEPGF